jgi:transcriptional regulator with XRE-family HTH domain
VVAVDRVRTPIDDQPVTVALRRLLEEHGATLRGVAAQTRELDEAGKGVNHTYISGVLSGREIPSLRSLELMARVFKIDPDYFVEYRMGKMREEINPRLVGFDAAFQAFAELEASRGRPRARQASASPAQVTN